jgi:hypothetical protein
MNLYKFHDKPETIHRHENAHETVPDLAWDKYGASPEKLKPYEKLFTKDPKWAYRYAWTTEMDNKKRGFPAGEDAIAKDPQTAWAYVKNIIKKRFPKGEAAIAKNTKYSIPYAVIYIKGPFPVAESEILKDPHATFEYVLGALKKPWPKGEAIMNKNSGVAREYRRFIHAYEKKEARKAEKADDKSQND